MLKVIFLIRKKEKSPLSEERRVAQRQVDEALIKAIRLNKDRNLLRRYLKTRFQLWNGVYPHKLKF